MVAAILEYERMVAPRQALRTHIDRDAELVEALRLGEPTAAETLVERYQGRAHRLALGITGNAQDAEEVVQDAFYDVVRRIEMFRGDASFGSWLYRIVANGACRKLRRRRWQRLEITWDEVLPMFDENGRHIASPVDWSAAVDDTSRDTEIRLALNAALDELPPHYRTVLVLRDVEGVSIAEIAEILGISVANVKVRVHRARLFVRNRLTESLSVASSPDIDR